MYVELSFWGFAHDIDHTKTHSLNCLFFHFLVYQKVLETAASVVMPCHVPLGTLLQFVSAIPREFTDHDGEWETFHIWEVDGRSSPNIMCFLFQVHCAK